MCLANRLWPQHPAGSVGTALIFLTGLVPDQAALYGLLAKLRDVGLALLSVDSEEVEEDETGEEDAPEQQGSPCTGTDPEPTANEVSNPSH